MVHFLQGLSSQQMPPFFNVETYQLTKGIQDMNCPKGLQF